VAAADAVPVLDAPPLLVPVDPPAVVLVTGPPVVPPVPLVWRQQPATNNGRARTGLFMLALR
jgi:hypothetical protein